MNKISDLLSKNILPLNKQCYVDGNEYVVGVGRYSVDMCASRFKNLLNEKKKVSQILRLYHTL